jgi:cytochrome c-type biogenesis protein CcmF
MLATFGEDLLTLAALVAALAALCGFAYAPQRGPFLLRVTRLSSVSVFVLVLGSFLALIAAFVVSDFSVVTVFQNSHTLKPLIYKIAGAWGNHEGSMLLWTLVLSLFAAWMAAFPPALDKILFARILAVLAFISAGFLSYSYFTSNPFALLTPAPQEGLGFNPVLQDPALAIHPPMLYLGYVGFSVAFAFAVAGLLTGRVDRAWAKALRPYVLVAWGALTLGIALGSWWAYYELGWGGWWFWDPVENASFIPWLSGTALLHSLIVVEKRGSFKSWTVLLALLTFTFSLVGTFLVRSGILTSVHSFALDPARGVFVLLLIGVIAGGGFLIFGLRAHALEKSEGFAALSRESLLALNNIFLMSAAATVFIGTLYPLLLEALTGDMISVGPPYYAATFVPLMIPVALLMGAAPYLFYEKGDWQTLRQALQTPLLLSLGVALASWMAWDDKEARFYLGAALAAWVLATTIQGLVQRRSTLAMALAHIGFGVSLLGAVVASHFSVETQALMKPGDTLKIHGQVLQFEDMEHVAGPNYLAEKAAFRISGSTGEITTLYPERRLYPVEQQVTSEVAIFFNGFANLYVALGEGQKEGNNVKGWAVRAYWHPFTPFIWLGCVLMALGAVASLMQRRGLLRAAQDQA